MNIAELLKNKPVLLLDGAMGTQLDRKGLMGRGRNNLDAAQAVLDIHMAYAGCGCDFLTTNTATMNRVYIETHGVDVPLDKVNQAGVDLADQAAGCGQYILGNMTSTGQLLEPYGEFTEAQFYAAFKEHAKVLAEAGVDGLIIETMFDLREAVCALRACKENTKLPVIVSIAFATEDKGGRTMMGNTAEQCATALTEAGADAIGANCGDLAPLQMAQVVKMLSEATDRPIVAQPNAGKPQLVEGKTVFDMGPEAFAEGIAACIQNGARLVGGCCGTGPEHIRAVKKIVSQM